MNVMKNRKGMTGLETAIILIAFVITAAAFSFVVLNMGFLSAQKTQTVISSGMKEAASSLQADGDVIATCTPPDTVDSVLFYVRVSQGKEAIDTDAGKMVITVTTLAGHAQVYGDAATGAVLTEIIGDGDGLVEQGERWSVEITFPDAPGPYETFRIEIRPATGSVLILERQLGAINNVTQVLE
jgi:archaeal flagellin FlaB